MKKLLSITGFALALVASSAYAIPTMFFDGAINYDVSTGKIQVTSSLVDTIDIVPAPNLTGSSLDFSAILNSVDTSSSYYTIGTFNGVAGDDLSVIDGDLNSLLTGEFLSLQMRGGNTFTSGLVTGVINATGGTLQTEFGTGNLIALELNLTTSFGANMFETSFSGNIDGRLEGRTASVPEPTIIALLGFGLAFIGIIRLPVRALKTRV
jgi:hypothetical protein